MHAPTSTRELKRRIEAQLPLFARSWVDALIALVKAETLQEIADAARAIDSANNQQSLR